HRQAIPRPPHRGFTGQPSYNRRWLVPLHHPATAGGLMSKVTVAAIQCAFSEDMNENIARIESFVEKAAKQGAQVILPPELLQGHYFCKEEKDHHFDTAYP